MSIYDTYYDADDYEIGNMCDYCDPDDFFELNMYLDDGHLIQSEDMFYFVDDLVNYLNRSNSSDAKSALYKLLKYDLGSAWAKQAVDAIGRDTDDWEELYSPKIYDWAEKEAAAGTSPFKYIDERDKGIRSTLEYSDLYEYADEDGLIPLSALSAIGWFH